MHGPALHGVGSRPGSKLSPTPRDVGFGENLLCSLINACSLAGLGAQKWTRDLPDGGAVTAVHHYGISRLIYDKPGTPPVEVPPVELQSPYDIPLFISGNVVKPASVREAPIEIMLTEPTRRRLVNYQNEDDEGVKFPKKKELFKKFIIPFPRWFVDIDPNDPAGGLPWTQYTNLYPSLYTGTMSTVVQIVMGYGRQFTKAEEASVLYHDRAKMTLPRSLEKPLSKWVDAYDFAAHKGVPDAGGRVMYDYKASRTHAVGIDVVGEHWLIEVAARGVHIMPLPMIPATTAPLFHDYIAEKSDAEFDLIIEQFGGLPSGESFPELDEDFSAWVKAGAIIKLCDTDTFYKNQRTPYFTACGWAFNSRGDEAWNTATGYNDDGLQQGYTYMMSLKLNAKLKPAPEKDPYLSPYLSMYLTSLGEALTGIPSRVEELAVKYKLKRSGTSEVSKRADSTNGKGKADLDYWRNYEMSPIANSSCTLSQVYVGNLYAEPVKENPQAKFPDISPMIFACISHVFEPEKDEERFKKTLCDTVIYCFFVDDKINYVRYFRDPKAEKKVTDEDEGDECMIVGAWNHSETTGNATMGGSFYTTDFDPRATVSPTESSTKIIGQDMGYGAPSLEWEQHPTPMDAYLTRERYFSTETESKSRHGLSLSNAICVPMFTRSACLHTFNKGQSGWEEGFRSIMTGVQDPTSYYVWTYHPRFHNFSMRAHVGGYVQTFIDTVNGGRYTVNRPRGGSGFSHWKDLATWFPSMFAELQNPSDVTIGWLVMALRKHEAFVEGWYPIGAPEIIPPYQGMPSPYAGDPLWLDYEKYTGNNGDCSSFADAGPWMTPVANVTEAVHSGQFNGKAPYFKPKTSSKSGVGGDVDGSLDLAMLERTVKIRERGSAGYYTMSPMPNGKVFQRAALKNSAGEKEFAILVMGDEWHQGASELVSTYDWLPRFIGVINE